MVHWKESYKFGKEKETEILPLLREYFQRDIQQYTNQFEGFDFYDDVTEYEVKSRTNEYLKYPTTMITRNKILKETTKNIILLFNFTDGLYYIKYNEPQFRKYEIRKFSRARIKSDEKEHIFIPISDLRKVDLDAKEEELVEEKQPVAGGIAEVKEGVESVEIKKENVGGIGMIL